MEQGMIDHFGEEVQSDIFVYRFYPFKIILMLFSSKLPTHAQTPSL